MSKQRIANNGYIPTGVSGEIISDTTCELLSVLSAYNCESQNQIIRMITNEDRQLICNVSITKEFDMDKFLNDIVSLI